jgi:hypothetical protein
MGIISCSLFENKKDFLINMKCTSFMLISLVLSGCTALDIQSWSSGEIVDGVISSAISGRQTSYGNEATCNRYKAIGGSSYRQWIKDGEIACSYKR